MIESIYTIRKALIEHMRAPMLEEREKYLRHLRALGKSSHELRHKARMLLNVMRVMKFTSSRHVTVAEIREAAQTWALEPERTRMRRGNKSSAKRFICDAREWMRFQRLLVIPTPPDHWYDALLREYVCELRSTRRLAPRTLQERYCDTARRFLFWASDEHCDLSSITLQDVDDYIEAKLISGQKLCTVKSECQSLSMFFRFAESRGCCERGFAQGIRNPVLVRSGFAPAGPSWKDVRRLIKSCNGESKSDRCAKAILLLCSVYALRSSEVTHLTLGDFDWYNETFTVKRLKRGSSQHFPIQYEVGQTIIEYLRTSRPQCACRSLFVTQHVPYRPLNSLWAAISLRMKKLGIESKHFGAHSLRHACATQLLRKGTSLRAIADFLGHRDLQSVSIYAKLDTRLLRAVANFSLAGVL